MVMQRAITSAPRPKSISGAFGTLFLCACHRPSQLSPQPKHTCVCGSPLPASKDGTKPASGIENRLQHVGGTAQEGSGFWRLLGGATSSVRGKPLPQGAAPDPLQATPGLRFPSGGAAKLDVCRLGRGHRDKVAGSRLSNLNNWWTTLQHLDANDRPPTAVFTTSHRRLTANHPRSTDKRGESTTS